MSESFSVKAILSAEDGSFRSVFNNAQGILQSFSTSTSGLLGGLSNVTNIVKSGLGFGIMSGIGQKAFSTVSGAVSGLTSNLGGAISRYDTLKQFPKTMELMGFKTEETEKASKKLVDAIDGLPTTLDGITANAQNIALVTGNLDKATDTTIALNNAFLMSGSSTAEAERGLTQYVQMMSAGKVDMQSWRTLLETMSPALTKVAESFGYTGESAKVDLYEALKSGKITFDDFNNRLIEMNDGMDISGEHFDGFAALAKTSTEGIGTSIENMKTMVTKQLANTVKAFDESGLNIATSLNAVKDKVNDIINHFIGTDKIPRSNAFTAIVDAGIKAKEALVDAFNNFSNSPAVEAAKKSIETIAINLGVILPNMIKAAEPIFEGLVSTVSRAFSAISDVIAKVTSSTAFQTFAENIGKAIEKVGGVVESVIKKLSPFIEATLAAANEVMSAFGKAFDAIVNSAKKADVAGTLLTNFNKVLGFVKDSLINVAKFLEKHHGLILWLIEHLPQIITLIFSVKAALAVMEKIRAFEALTKQVSGFIESITKAGHNVGSFVSNIVSKFTGGTTEAGNQLTSFSGRADTAWMNISKGADSAGGSITSKIGGAFSTLASKVGGALGNVASSVGNVISTIGSIAGPIAMVAGPAIAAITGIVNAVVAWREKQKEIGEKLVEFTEDQQAVIDKNKELADSYNAYKDSLIEKAQESEAEIGLVANLREEYNKLLDSNGEVIKGKEELAAAIQDKIFNAMGIEKSQIDDLRNEYISLIDQNGNIKQGYEDRAAAIEQALSEIIGHEISGKEQVISINEELMGSIDQLIEKKRLEAQAEMLQDAVIEAQKKRKELNDQRLETLDLLAQKEKELADIGDKSSDKYIENSTQRQAAQAKINEQMEELKTQEKTLSDQIIQTQKDEEIATEGVTKALEEQLDTTGEFAGQTQLYWKRYIGDVTSAEEAVRKHGTAAREVLEQQVTVAQEKYDQLKAAYDAHEEGITQAQVENAKKELEFAKEQRQALLEDNKLGYAEQLQKQIEADNAQIEEAQKTYDELKNKRQDQYGQATNAQKEMLDKLKAQRDEDQKKYDEYMNGLNSSTQTGYDNINKSTDSGLSNVNATANAKMQEGTSNAGKESQNTSNAYTGGLFGMIASATDIAVKSTQGMVSNLEKATPGVSTAAGNAKNAATKGFNGMDSDLASTGARAMLGLQGSLIVSSVMSMFIGSTVGNITRPFQSMDLGSAGSNAMIGMYNGMVSRANMLYGLANTIARNIAATIQAALQIHSPSRLTKWMGQMLGQGLADGIAGYQNRAEKAAQAMADSTAEQFKRVNNLIAFPNALPTPNIPSTITSNSTFTKDERYNYSGSFQATIEVPVNLNGREVSRLTVDTDSQEQYYNKKRYAR